MAWRTALVRAVREPASCGPLREGHGRQHRAVPGAEVLGRDLSADDLLDVDVDVVRGDVPPSPAVAVGEQFGVAPAAPAQVEDRRTDGVVGHADQPLLTGLRRVLEDDLVAIDAHVLLADRRQPVAAVVLGVLLAADAEEAEVEEPERRRQHPLARQAVEGQVLGHDGTSCGSRVANCSTRACLALSRSSRQAGWYRYCRRPASSVPTAWRWPFGRGQIHTSVHAGGIVKALQRATSSAPSGSPVSSR